MCAGSHRGPASGELAFAPVAGAEYAAAELSAAAVDVSGSVGVAVALDAAQDAAQFAAAPSHHQEAELETQAHLDS
jgi:hypothetical protein